MDGIYASSHAKVGLSIAPTEKRVDVIKVGTGRTCLVVIFRHTTTRFNIVIEENSLSR